MYFPPWEHSHIYKAGWYALVGAQGLGVGIAGAVALPVAGVVSASIQISRGIYNTPEAVDHTWNADAVWDEASGKWNKQSIQVSSLTCMYTHPDYPVKCLGHVRVIYLALFAAGHLPRNFPASLRCWEI